MNFVARLAPLEKKAAIVKREREEERFILAAEEAGLDPTFALGFLDRLRDLIPRYGKLLALRKALAERAESLGMTPEALIRALVTATGTTGEEPPEGEG